MRYGISAGRAYGSRHSGMRMLPLAGAVSRSETEGGCMR